MQRGPTATPAQARIEFGNYSQCVGKRFNFGCVAGAVGWANALMKTFFDAPIRARLPTQRTGARRRVGKIAHANLAISQRTAASDFASSYALQAYGRMSASLRER